MTDQEIQSREDFRNRLTWEKEGNVYVGYTQYAKQIIEHVEHWSDFKSIVAMKVEHMLYFDYVRLVYPDGKMIDHDLLPTLEPGPMINISIRHEERRHDSLSMKIEIYRSELAHEFIFSIEEISMAYGKRPLSWLSGMVEKECERFIHSITTGYIKSQYESYVAAIPVRKAQDELQLPKTNFNALYSEGLAAVIKYRTKGCIATPCPYPKGSKQKEWCRGWSENFWNEDIFPKNKTYKKPETD